MSSRKAVMKAPPGNVRVPPSDVCPYAESARVASHRVALGKLNVFQGGAADRHVVYWLLDDGPTFLIGAGTVEQMRLLVQWMTPVIENVVGVTVSMANRSKTGVVSLLSLEGRCEACAGLGWIAGSGWAEWNDRFDKAKKRTGSVQQATAEAGPYPETPETECCKACAGTGLAPTDAGRELLAFLSRHGNKPQ